jgi:hypothetical protein
VLLPDAIVSPVTTPRIDGLDGPSQTRTPRLACQTPAPSQTPTPIQREAQEVEGARTFALLLLLWSRKGQQARFVRVEGQSLTLQPLWQHLSDALGIFPMLKTDDKVIRIADEAGTTTQAWLYLLGKPQVENVVQIDVAQQRRQD